LLYQAIDALDPDIDWPEAASHFHGIQQVCLTLHSELYAITAGLIDSQGNAQPTCMTDYPGQEHDRHSITVNNESFSALLQTLPVVILPFLQFDPKSLFHCKPLSLRVTRHDSH
jgi:hypothetical protein